MKRSVVMGIGGYLPENVVTNSKLAETLETSDEWIAERTGIRQRHIAAKDEMTSDLAAKAARVALKQAGIGAADIDLVILATTTPDYTMPSTATRVQHLLGMKKAFAFDVNAACSGFIYALSIADGLLRTGQAKRAIVIGAEIYSRILDWKDRGTCILFGDGAGAMVLEAQEGKGTSDDRGILHTVLHSDGEFGPILGVNGGVASTQAAGTLFMAGKEVFRHAVEKMALAVEESLAACNLPPQALDWVVPHQANHRILSAVGKKLSLPEDRLISSVSQHANTSAASIPLALWVSQAKIKPGNLITLPALGAGLTWGNCIIRW